MLMLFLPPFSAELAHRLSQTFGVDSANTEAARERRDKARMGRRYLHQEAIKWSLSCMWALKKREQWSCRFCRPWHVKRSVCILVRSVGLGA